MSYIWLYKKAAFVAQPPYQCGKRNWSSDLVECKVEHKWILMAWSVHHWTRPSQNLTIQSVQRVNLTQYLYPMRRESVSSTKNLIISTVSARNFVIPSISIIWIILFIFEHPIVKWFLMCEEFLFVFFPQFWIYRGGVVPGFTTTSHTRANSACEDANRYEVALAHRHPAPTARLHNWVRNESRNLVSRFLEASILLRRQNNATIASKHRISSCCIKLLKV